MKNRVFMALVALISLGVVSSVSAFGDDVPGAVDPVERAEQQGGWWEKAQEFGAGAVQTAGAAYQAAGKLAVDVGETACSTCAFMQTRAGMPVKAAEFQALVAGFAAIAKEFTTAKEYTQLGLFMKDHPKVFEAMAQRADIRDAFVRLVEYEPGLMARAAQGAAQAGGALWGKMMGAPSPPPAPVAYQQPGALDWADQARREAGRQAGQWGEQAGDWLGQAGRQVEQAGVRWGQEAGYRRPAAQQRSPSPSPRMPVRLPQQAAPRPAAVDWSGF